MKKIASLCVLFVLFFRPVLFAQDIVLSESAVQDSSKSSFLHENDGKKHWFTALGGMLFFNVGLASYNRFVIGSGWAKVGPDEWNRFWERDFEYDHDWYWTNFVLHPYQGSMYYMVSRNSNLNALESFGITLLGSAFWEYLCETNAPSINDMVYTSIGSFAVGEMLYRLSLNADEVSSLLGFAVNPMRVWSQLWTRQKPAGRRGTIHELAVAFGIGSARTYTNILGDGNYFDYEQTEVFPVYFSPSLFVVYNDPYGHDSNSPYSQFELALSASVGPGSGHGSDCAYKEIDEKLMYNIRIESNGMLWSRAPDFGENIDTTVGLVMNYDFDWHQFYELSSLAPGIAVKQRIRFDSSRIEWQFHGCGIILGTTDFYYYHRPLIDPEEHVFRNYSFTTGAQTALKFRYVTDKGTQFNAGFRGYAMYDFYGQLQKNASTGWEWIGFVNAGCEIPLSKKVRIGMSDEVYLKRAFYKKVPDVFQAVNSASIYTKMQLK